jgi:hypothetical protein
MMIITPEQADELETALQEADLDITVRHNYSGRGMYGTTCLGFDVDRGTTAFEFGIRLGQLLGDNPEIADDELLDEMADNNAIDSMGLGSIIYFPSVRVEAEEDEEAS